MSRLLALALLVGGLLAAPPVLAGERGVAAYYPQEDDAAATLDTALAKARAEGKLAVIVFGADWCHDSQALAALLTSERFKAEFGGRFAVTFIDVGVPQDGRGRNLDLAKRFGVGDLEGTPTMVVIAPGGKRLNSEKDAKSWRNAESRGEAAVLDWFRRIATKG